MDFTREPIIETIITPKEGYKLVIRSSKSIGQEEYFVDAAEIVAFGHALFFRSLERPKAFLLPVADYEVLEVREARMILKNVGIDRSIKIAGGREGALKAPKETEKEEHVVERGVEPVEAVQQLTEASMETRPEVRIDKKRDRRRHYRKRRGREEEVKEESIEIAVPSLEDDKVNIPPPEEGTELASEGGSGASVLLSSLLQPPSTLISETINRYRQSEMFKGAFYLTEEEQYKPHDKVQELLNEDEDEETPSLKEPSFVVEDASQTPFQPILDDFGVEERIMIEEEPKKTEKQEEEEQAKNSSFIFEEEKGEESQHSLPLYAQEEDPTMLTEEASYTPEQQEGKPVTNNNHSSHFEG